MEAAHTEPVEEDGDSSDENDGQQNKPEPAIKGRPHIEGNLCSGFIPGAIIVRGLHTETIVTGWQVSVVGDTAWAGFSPLFVKAFENIAIVDFCRR